MKKQTDTTKKLYTLMLLVEDVPGVLSQVSRLFSRKGYNIESIVSGETEKPGITRITISIIGDEAMIDLVSAQCQKLYPVISVKVINEENAIRWEVAMIKVQAKDRNTREEIIQLANIFRANIIDVSLETLTIAMMGEGKKLKAFTDMLTDYGVLEVAKTGTIAIERGRSTIYDENKLKEEYNYGKNVL